MAEDDAPSTKRRRLTIDHNEPNWKSERQLEKMRRLKRRREEAEPYNDPVRMLRRRAEVFLERLHLLDMPCYVCWSHPLTLPLDL